MKPDLYKILTNFENPQSLKLFLQDLCTPQELKALEERLWVATLLNRGMTYRTVHQETRASLVTITRVARFLKTESYGGYRALFQDMLI